MRKVYVEIKRPTRCNRLVSLLQNLLFAQRVSGTIMPIIGSSRVIQMVAVKMEKQIRHWTQKNPHPPALKAQLKLHKHEIPMRAVVNNRSAPSYKMAKKLNDILKQCLHLNNHYTIDSSTNLAHNLTKLTIRLTLSQQTLYIYHAPSKARIANVIYISH